MRQKLLPLVVVIFLSALSQVGFAQQGPGPGPGKAFAPENFNETKARVLRMIEERRERLDQEKACVEASKNTEELKKCRPEPRMGRGGMNQQGPREQRETLPGPGQRQ